VAVGTGATGADWQELNGFWPKTSKNRDFMPFEPVLGLQYLILKLQPKELKLLHDRLKLLPEGLRLLHVVQ